MLHLNFYVELTLDLVVLHRDRSVIEHCRHRTQAWLKGIGLELSEPKTRIAHTLEEAGGAAGFNFLGFVRHEVAYTAVMTKGSDITWCAATSTLPSHAAGVI